MKIPAIIITSAALLTSISVYSQIIVSPEIKIGEVKQMHCVNNGPKGSRSPHLSTFQAFADAGIPMARLHDSPFQWRHAVDIDQVFPDFEANEDKEESYDFACTDAYLKSLDKMGVEIFYRLGQSIEHEAKKYGTIPPRDYKKWARICEHIIMHYNEGWADGFHFDIKYWEIWNEADLGCNNENWKTQKDPTWNGSREEFFKFFETVSKHLKKKYPELKIGGPALCSYLTWADQFLAYCRDHGVELDFFSWHRYTNTPEKVIAKAEKVDSLLKKYNYDTSESILDEWNYNLGWVQNYAYSKDVIHSEKGAAFNLAVMQDCQNSSVDKLMYYDARATADWNGLFNISDHSLYPGYYSFYVWNKLYNLGTQIRTVIPDEYRNIRATAAMNSKGRIGVAVSYFTDTDGVKECEPAAVRIRIEGVSSDTEYLGYLTDKNNTFAGITPHMKDGEISISLWPNSFVYFETR